MAVKTYRATAQGYIDGRVIEVGEVFTTEFKAIKRKEAKTKDGRLVQAGDIERDKSGNAVMVACDPPTWAEEVDKAEAAAQLAAQRDFPADPDLDAMDLSGLQAYAAERGVPFTGLKKADLITAIRAANDPTR